ncbi:MAG: transporter, partial [Bacteroidales bacterium]|nr:transporter [Bacteroidales bacterium]
RQRVTTFTIVGNLPIAVAAPIIFAFIGEHRDLPFMVSFWQIFKRIASIIALPFFTALLLQIILPKANDTLARYKGTAFYLWAIVLFITLGQTIDFIFLHGKENLASILTLAGASIVVCAIQFTIGRALGKRYGDKIAGGQLLFQKNTAVGIWMANTYLHPLSSVYPACYSICQNIVNSIQMWLHDRKKE